MERLTLRDDDGRALLTPYGLRIYCSTQATADCICKLEEALNAQEPRLITYADFENKELVDSAESMPAWIEYRHGEEWDEYNDGNDDGWSVVHQFNFESEFYRCWTSRPDNATREATPWEC